MSCALVSLAQRTVDSQSSCRYPRGTCRRGAAVCVRASAEPQTTSKPSGQMAGEYVSDDEFSISKVSFGSILTPVGLGLLFWGFGAYFTLLPGADLSSIMLIYGFPISLLGFALNYAKVRAAAPRPLGQGTLRGLLVLMNL